jgi:hypothetical protein
MQECLEALKEPDEKRCFTITEYDIVEYNMHYYNDHVGNQIWTVALNESLVSVQAYIGMHYTGFYGSIGPPEHMPEGEYLGAESGYCYIEIDGKPTP